MRSTIGFIAPALVLAACYSQSLPSPDPAPVAAPSGAPAAVALQDAADDHGVPADLLAALAWVETGFGTPDDDRLGYLGLDAAEQSRAASLGAPASGRAFDAGAALLADLRDAVAPDADALGAAWFPVVAAWSDAPEAWQRDLFAQEVFAVLQRGLVAPTERMAQAPDDDEVVVIAPRWVDLAGVPLLPEPSVGPGDYPGALARFDSDAVVPRPGGGDAIDRIAVRALPGAYPTALADALAGAPAAHYVVRRTDGETRQTAGEAWALAGEDDGEVSIGVAGPTFFGTWTVPAMEASATAAAWLAYRYQLPIAEETFALPGGDFPAVRWMNLVACIAAGEGECEPVAGTPVGEARSDERAISVPYFYQYANARHPGASCQNTSIAMVLKKYGWTGTPDTITGRFGKDRAQSPGGLADVFNTLAQEAGLSVRLTAHTSGSLDRFHQLLAAGKPVITHGYFTGYGHVLVTTGYDGSAYTVNDPAGKWAQTFKGGYPYGWSASAGDGVRYGKAAFVQAIATSNGSSYLPLWFHELTGVEGDAPEPTDAPDEPEPPADEPTAPADEPATPAPPAPTAPDDPPPSSFPWASVQWLEPSDGDTVGNPALLRAERVSGATIGYWAGPYRLSDDLPGNPAATTAEFQQTGPRRLTARNVSAYGTVLASASIDVTIEGDAASGGCSVLGTIACGQRVTGSTAGYTNQLSGYPEAVGNWAGPEVGYTWTGTGGPVEIRLTDVDLDLVDHDVLILEDDGASCSAANQQLIAFNSLVFESRAGASYTFVVDGFSGQSGPYALELDCDL